MMQQMNLGQHGTFSFLPFDGFNKFVTLVEIFSGCFNLSIENSLRNKFKIVSSGKKGYLVPINE